MQTANTLYKPLNIKHEVNPLKTVSNPLLMELFKPDQFTKSVASRFAADEQTVVAYGGEADSYAKKFEAYDAKDTIGPYLQLAFPQAGSTLLDIGAGSGRDMLYLQQQGYKVYGVEPSNLKEWAEKNHPDLAGCLEKGSVPDLGKPFNQTYDGVLCSAVLMHLSDEELRPSLKAIYDVLKPNGRLLLSVPARLIKDYSESGHRASNGRLFNPNVTADTISELCQELGFKSLPLPDNITPDAKKDELMWQTLLFEKKAQDGLI